MAGYCCVTVGSHTAQTRDQRAERGWTKDGLVVFVYRATGTGWLPSDEIFAKEGASDGYWEVRPAFLAYLDRLAGEGWRVVQYTPSSSVRDPNSWPKGDFLLFRET